MVNDPTFPGGWGWPPGPDALAAVLARRLARMRSHSWFLPLTLLAEDWARSRLPDSLIHHYLASSTRAPRSAVSLVLHVARNHPELL